MLSVLKLIQGSEVFEDFSSTFLTLNGQENYVFKKTFMYVFQKRCLSFVFAVEERLQNAARFEVDFLLNFAMCSSDFPCL